MRSYAMLHMGDLADARSEAERALDIGEKIKSSGLITTAHMMLGVICADQDQGPESRGRFEKHLRRGIEVSANAGDQGFHYFTHGTLAWLLAMVGRFGEAAQEMERCFALAARVGGQLLWMDQFIARRADIALGLGQRKGARALAQQAVEISRQTGSIWAEAHAGRAMARILATDSPPDFDGADAQFARSLQLYESGHWK